MLTELGEPPNRSTSMSAVTLRGTHNAPTFREKVTDLAAPIHGKSKNELASDDVREQRRSRWLRRAAIAGLVALTVVHWSRQESRSCNGKKLCSNGKKRCSNGKKLYTSVTRQ